MDATENQVVAMKLFHYSDRERQIRLLLEKKRMVPISRSDNPFTPFAIKFLGLNNSKSARMRTAR